MWRVCVCVCACVLIFVWFWLSPAKVVKENKIILFMKGNKDFPQCGFSNTVTQVCVRVCLCSAYSCIRVCVVVFVCVLM